jgi:hypothetical protein
VEISFFPRASDWPHFFYPVRYYAAQPSFRWNRLTGAQLCVHYIEINRKDAQVLVEVYINSYLSMSVLPIPIKIKYFLVNSVGFLG